MIDPRKLHQKQTSTTSCILFPSMNENTLDKQAGGIGFGSVMGDSDPIIIRAQAVKLMNCAEWNLTAKIKGHKGPFSLDEEVVTRSQRRALKRAVKRKKEKEAKEEDKWFQELYRCCVELGDNPEEDSVCEKVSQLSKDIQSKNCVLKYYTWLINEIAMEILNSPELRDKCFTKPEAFTRDRKLSLEDMFTILLAMAGDNLNNELYEYFKLKPEQVSAPAFVTRRGLITEYCVQYLYERVTQACKVLSYVMPQALNFQEFNSILAADGSDINVAHNPYDEETYIDGGKDGKGWNQIHLNVMYCVLNGMIERSVIQTKRRTHETKAAVDMIRSMTFEGKNLFMGDRGYACLNLIETIRRTENIDCVIRAKENWIREVAELPLEELDQWMTIHVITTQTNEDKERVKQGTAKYLSGVSRYGKNKVSKVWDYESEVDVTFRVVRLHLDAGTWETIITTLDEVAYPPEKIKELYFLRWGGVENAFRVLKWDNHLAQMHCKKSEYARQEVWARLTMHNIVSSVVSCAYAVEKCTKETSHEVEATKREQKHERIINRRFATHVVCDYLKNADYLDFDVIQLLLRFKTPVRSGRSFKRDMRAIGFAHFFYR